MQVILDQQPIEQNSSTVKYAGFWIRFVAVLLDGLILAPITIGFGYFNMISLKSIPLLVLLTIVGLAYKPVMEHMYGATLAKMAFKLKVVGSDFQQASLNTILLRNIFNILPGLVSLIFSIQMFTDPEFLDVTGFQDFAIYSNQIQSSQAMSIINFSLMFIDSIMLGIDEQKRSLHDRIAGTYVIEK